MSRLEGNGASRMKALIKKHGYNKDVDVETGVVTSVPPSIKIRLENDGLELDSDDVVVAWSLTERELTVDLSGGQVSGSTTDGSLNSLTVSSGKLTIKSPLKVGDKVIVLSANNGQQYFVIDKAVTY